MSNPKTANVVIVGGGISGVAIAWNLAKKGVKDIVVLEKKTVCSGATGRCGAGIRMQWGAEQNCLLAKMSVEFFENANEILEYDRDVEFDQGGYLIVAGNEKENELFKKNIALQNSLGIPSKHLTPQEAKEIIPHMDETQIVGATFCQKDGHLNPFNTTEAFAKAAERLGVKILKKTKVTGIDVKNDKIVGVETTAGYISTPLVINAAGGWAQEVGKMAGVDLPLYSERHQILVTEPVERIQDPMYMAFSLNIYIQQTPHGSFIMGRSNPAEPRDLRVTSSWQFLHEMINTCTTLLPPLRKLNLVRQWAGLYNMTEDAQPIYGKVDNVEGFWLACGYSGHGFMLAPATGILLTEMILGEPLSIDITNLDLGRFERGELCFETSVV